MYKVITLCGSSSFKDDFICAQEMLTLRGNIVLPLCLYGHADKKYETVITPEVKKMLDDMHKQKIDMSDAIYVVNSHGYIGKSTAAEIEYAKSKNKEILYMLPPV